MNPLLYSLCVAGVNLVIALAMIGLVESIYGLIELKKEMEANEQA